MFIISAVIMSVSVHFVSYGLSLTIKGMWHLYTSLSKLIHTDLEFAHIYSKPASTCPSLLTQRRDRVETNTATSSSSYIILIIISIVPDHKQCIHSNPHSLLSTLKTPGRASLSWSGSPSNHVRVWKTHPGWNRVQTHSHTHSGAI